MRENTNMDYFVFCGNNWDYYFCRKNRDSELECLENVVLTTEYDEKRFIDLDYNNRELFLQYAPDYNFFSKLYYIAETDYNEFVKNTWKKINPEHIVMIGWEGGYYLSDLVFTNADKCDTFENVKLVSLPKQPNEYIDYDHFNSWNFIIYA